MSKALSSRRLSMAKRDSFQDATLLQQEKMLIADHFGINSRSRRADSSKGALTESMILRKLEKSNDYFEEGSSLRNLLDSGLEVVWMSDRHPDDVTLGNSLGGGLATVAGYFLASDSRLELASAVRVFTFSAGRVGCQAFQQGFKHLEETGRLQLARFTNSNDIKTLLPIQDGYKHTGMQIRLHKSDRAGRQRARSALDVTYNRNESRLGVIFHFLFNIVSASRSSNVSEYQHRLNSTREYRLALSNGGEYMI